jgi:undecaprenyl-diphosphatase
MNPGWLARRRIRPYRPLVFPAVAIGAIWALAVMLGSLAWFDEYTTGAVNRLPRWLEPFFTAMAFVGSMGMLIVAAIAMAIVEASDRRWVRAGAMLGSLLALPTFYLIKETVRRARPVSEFVRAHGLHDYSFPSGHSTGSAAVYGVMTILIMSRVPQRWKVPVAAGGALLIFCIGLSRVYLGAHFPTDVLGGWLLGLVFASVIRTITLMFAKKQSPLEDTTESNLSQT